MNKKNFILRGQFISFRCPKKSDAEGDWRQYKCTNHHDCRKGSRNNIRRRSRNELNIARFDE